MSYHLFIVYIGLIINFTSINNMLPTHTMENKIMSGMFEQPTNKLKVKSITIGRVRRHNNYMR